MIPEKYPVNKPMAAAGIGYVVIFLLFVIAKSIFRNSWGNLPMVDYLFLLGTGICISILAAGYTYYSWVLAEEEYIKWYADQQLFGKKFIGARKRFYPPGIVIWTNRLVAPMAGIIGFFMMSFALFLIFKLIFYR